jgi:urease accessory protein
VDRASNWLVWQLVDSAFPTGGFAHSNGLEAAWQQGEVGDALQLKSFLHANLHQFASAALPFVAASYDDPGRLVELDQLCHAFTSNHVANRASRSQGKAFLLATARIFGFHDWEHRSSGRTAGLTPTPPFGHLAPVFGAAMRRLEVEFSTASRLFLFIQIRGTIAAAVRLNIVGPLEGQAIQHELIPAAEAALKQSPRTLDDVAQTAPLLDTWQGAHDRLYSRLFQS